MTISSKGDEYETMETTLISFSAREINYSQKNELGEREKLHHGAQPSVLADLAASRQQNSVWLSAGREPKNGQKGHLELRSPFTHRS